VRFTITPLGSAGGRSVGQVVDDIVRYLDGPKPPAPPSPGRTTPSEGGASTYYADGKSEAGRWLGNGAAEMVLDGAVDPRDFALVLAGRDPHTGVRLITAQGSAGRRPTLARGTQTRWDADGEPLYDTRDAATALKLEVAEVERMVAAGEVLAVGALAALVGAAPATPPAPFEGAYLLPTIDPDGPRWLSERELQRCEAARAAGPDPDAIAAAGDPEDILVLADAARLAGVSSQYLRSLCRRWERDRDKIEAAHASGEEPPRPFLTAYRGTKGQWLVKRADLVDYLNHRSAPAVRVGFDLTLTTEKSLGVLALLGDDHTRSAVLGAIQTGNDRGLAHLEYAAAMARAKGEPVSTRGWTVASFRHLTSRALDPFPHHHNVVANTVVDPDGTRRALDARWLYRHAGEASALATAEMRYRLTSELGVRWRCGRKGGWEIDGIPDKVLREFSRRSNEVDEAVAELEALVGRTATIGELRGLVTKTRPAKRQAEAGDLVAGWWERARRLSFTPRRLARCAGRARTLGEQPDSEAIFRALTGPRGICAESSVFTRADLIAAIVDMPTPAPEAKRPRPLLLSADEVEQLATEFLSSDLVVELLPEERGGIVTLADEPLFTTAAMLAVQARITEWVRAGRGAGAATVATAVVDAVLDEQAHLNREQRHLVMAFCTSGDRLQCAVGRAGAGKTTAMRAAAAAWGAAGYGVLGAAVKGEAARILSAEAGVPAETVAWHLMRARMGDSPLDARTVLIVDEASTVSDRDLDPLLRLADQTGASVRLIGDPAQHGAVTAGGMFSVLCDGDPDHTPELAVSHRVTDPHDRAAADALRDGRIADALAALDAAGHLHVVDDELDLYLDLLARWWDSRQAGSEHPMVDRRNHTRWQLNRLAHRLLQATGDVGTEEVVASGDRRFSVGDRVIARTPGRKLHPPERRNDYVRNGAVGTVVAVNKRRNRVRDTISVRFDGIGAVDLPRSFFDEHERPDGRKVVGLDHAYAATSYSVQGATFAESTSRIDEKARRPETYVDITRGRSANHLYLTRGADPIDGERLPRAPSPPIATAVTARLSGSGPERAAVDVDPSATDAAAARAGRGMAELHAASTEATKATAIAAAAELRARQLARQGPRGLDPAILDRLPPRSTVPFLARQWDETVADLSVFLARWDATPGGSGSWQWALGGTNNEAHFDRERRRLAVRIIDLTVATARDSFGRQDLQLPAWARAHLAYHAARGACVHEPKNLAALYQRIGAYRNAAGVEDAERGQTIEETIFGPPSEDAALRMQRRSLVEETLPRKAVARQALAHARA